MTSKSSQEPQGRHTAAGRGVLDPAWEQELERGRDADVEAPDAGSIEPELAMLHLLRHAREPEALNDQELDSMWSDISTAMAPAHSSWMARVGAAFSGQWARWLVPVAGAAAIVLVFSSTGSNEDAGIPGMSGSVAMNEAKSGDAKDAPGAPTRQDAARERSAVDADSPAEAEQEEAGPRASGAKGGSSTAALLEQQFTMLEARGRAAVDSNVQSQRTNLRSALIGKARKGAK